MRKKGKALLAGLLAAILLGCCGARAEFSPRYTALKNDQAVQAEISGELETLSPLSEASLAVVNGWLGRAKLRLTSMEGANRSLNQAELLLDGNSVFSAAAQGQTDYTLTVFSPSGGAYLTAPGLPDALALLSGQADGLPQPGKFLDAYFSLAPRLYEYLSTVTTPKKSSEKTSIKNATASAGYENYILTADEMNASWPKILETLLPALQSGLQNAPGAAQSLEELLRSLTFSGECRFKRFLDKAGEDMGLQFTGRAQRGDDDVRKITLFGGYTAGKGGYLSLALPAVKGKNNWKLTCTGKLTEKSGQRTLTLSSAYNRVYAGETASATLEASLKNALKNDTEAWSGKITLTQQKNGKKTAWTLQPALTFDGEGLHGDVAVQRKTGSTVDLKATARLSLRALADIPSPAAASAMDLRGMEEAQAKLLLLDEAKPLRQTLLGLLNELDEDARALLTHDLRTDDWMNGPLTAVPEDTAAGWPVEEEQKQ